MLPNGLSKAPIARPASVSGPRRRLCPLHQSCFWRDVSRHRRVTCYQEAIPLLKKHIALYSGDPWAHVALIVSYTELGRDTEARAEAAELMRINPAFVYGNVNKDEAVDKRWQSDLRKAGLK